MVDGPGLELARKRKPNMTATGEITAFFLIRFVAGLGAKSDSFFR